MSLVAVAMMAGIVIGHAITVVILVVLMATHEPKLFERSEIV